MKDWFEKITIGTAVDRAAATFRSHTAIHFCGQGWTFRDLQAEVNRAACGLLNCGIQPGDKVALWL